MRIFDKYNFNQIKNIFIIWFTIFSIILFDCLFEIIFGFNLTGNKANDGWTNSEFFGEELIVGAFVHGFALFALSFFNIPKSKKKLYSIFKYIIYLNCKFFDW